MWMLRDVGNGDGIGSWKQCGMVMGKHMYIGSLHEKSVLNLTIPEEGNSIVGA